ncbi:Gfo/Idh/MocA family oxidoreductase [Eubacteriales bacterium OttesenSCG-928-G02]|nr:Gfo/Idh/MocA family oxidoreductase [Eubacteriales bacterium OttesenSCG-928-G02]
MSVKIGIIGAGNIGSTHAGSYQKCPNAKITAVCDIDFEKAKSFAARFNIPNAYASYDEMLAAEELDGVSVCTWNSAHKDATIASLKAGVNVLCEKPMAMNRFEAMEMEKVANETGKLLMIGFVRRFSSDTYTIKKFIDGGSVGDIYYIKAAYLRRNGCPGGWFGDMRYSGGGPLIDLGVHVMDISRYFAGCPKPVSAYGYSYNNLGPNRAIGYTPDPNAQFKNDVEDFSGGIIKFDNGMTLSMEASFNMNIKSDSQVMEIHGTKGGINLHPSLQLFTQMNGMYVDVAPSNGNYNPVGWLFDEEMNHFVACISEGIECKSPARDGVILMEIIDAIYESAKTNKLVEIK